MMNDHTATDAPQATPAVGARLEPGVRPLSPQRADAPEELPTPGSCNVPPMDVWPVPEDGQRHKLEAGPWMPGEWRPAREGKYLRYWPGSDDLAFSFWRSGLWHAGPFFDSKSDAQDLPWRGGVHADRGPKFVRGNGFAA
jgi:hypothetical protein